MGLCRCGASWAIAPYLNHEGVPVLAPEPPSHDSAMAVPSECHYPMLPCQITRGTVPKPCRDAGLHTLASIRFRWKLPKRAVGRISKSGSYLMPAGTHLGESRSSQSSERSQSVFGLFSGWVRPGVGGAARSRTTRKGLCSIGIYEKPAAGMATGLQADSDGLSNPKTGGAGNRTRVPEHFR